MFSRKFTLLFSIQVNGDLDNNLFKSGPYGSVIHIITLFEEEIKM